MSQSQSPPGLYSYHILLSRQSDCCHRAISRDLCSVHLSWTCCPNKSSGLMQALLNLLTQYSKYSNYSKYYQYYKYYKSSGTRQALLDLLTRPLSCSALLWLHCSTFAFHFVLCKDPFLKHCKNCKKPPLANKCQSKKIASDSLAQNIKLYY